MLPPPSSAADLTPPPLEVLLPHTPPARHDVQSWAIALQGSSLPAPSVRGLGGSQTLGMHDGIGGSLGGYVGRDTPAGGEGWSMALDGWAAWGKMVILIGEVVVAS